MFIFDETYNRMFINTSENNSKEIPFRGTLLTDQYTIYIQIVKFEV